MLWAMIQENNIVSWLHLPYNISKNAPVKILSATEVANKFPSLALHFDSISLLLNLSYYKKIPVTSFTDTYWVYFWK